jgi:hypothetical protein
MYVYACVIMCIYMRAYRALLHIAIVVRTYIICTAIHNVQLIMMYNVVQFLIVHSY